MIMTYNFRERLTGVDVFLSSWCDRSGANNSVIEIKKSYAGNINKTGVAIEGAEAYLLPISHGQFWNSIEKGIEPLVRFFTEDRRLVTFTSCEGHLYKNGRYSPRNVGIIMRSEYELNSVILLISDVTKIFNQKCERVNIKFYVYDMGDDKGNLYKAIKIIFVKTDKTTIGEYFLNLESATSKYLSFLQEKHIGDSCFLK